MKETIEVFRPNGEAQAQRNDNRDAQVMQQYQAEFGYRQYKSWFDTLIDGLNRLPRPMLALGIIGLVASSMWAPIWFATRMQGLALVPDPLWAIMGIVITFYFGGRHQVKMLDAQESIAKTMQAVPTVIGNIRDLHALSLSIAADDTMIISPDDKTVNEALDEWRKKRGSK